MVHCWSGSAVVTLVTIILPAFGISNVYLNISTNTLVSVNGYDKTSNFLLGLTAYANTEILGNDSYLKQVNQDLGVNVVGYGELLHYILPTSQSEAEKCCNTVDGLKSYIQSGQACANYKNSYDPKVWNSNYYKQDTTMSTFIYLIDSCNSGYQPEINHCLGPDTAGGTPNNADGWWTEMMVGFVNCSLQLDSNAKYYHIWNEPNAHFWKYDKNGTYYAEFYYNVTNGIKQHYPNTIISGPVTWCPPLWGNTWEDYYVSLMQKIVVKEGKKDLLNYIDFHSYDNGNSNLSAWDYTISSINAVSLYYGIITNGGNIRSHITETNVVLSDSQNNDKAYHWNFRDIENAKQILALSFNPDKFMQRHLFDLDATDFNFYRSIDYYMNDVIKPIQNGNMVQFKFADHKVGYPKYDNGDGVQSQVIYNEADGILTVIIISYDNEPKNIQLTDLDKKIKWNSKGRSARDVGINNAFPVNVNVNGDSSIASLYINPYEIVAVTGNYGSNKPEQTMDLVEFGPNNVNDIMRIIGNSTYDEDFSVGITVKSVPNGKNAIFAFIKFGFIGDALSDYKWNIQVKIGDNSYLNQQGFITNIQFNKLGLSTDILDELKDGTVVTILFNGQRRTRRRLYYNGGRNVGADIPGRFVFASLVVEYL